MLPVKLFERCLREPWVASRFISVSTQAFSRGYFAIAPIASGRYRPDRKIPSAEGLGRTLMKRPSTHSFPEAEFEQLYRENVKRRKKWLSQFIADVAVAAE